MSPADYIKQQPAERQALLKNIHAIIVAGDQTVKPGVEPMMGKEMILYKAGGTMKYGLAGVQKYMSLHILPMYMVPAIYDKYKALLPKANFQKGCINFTSGEQMPLNIVKQLAGDCAGIDMLKIRDEQLQARKAAKRK